MSCAFRYGIPALLAAVLGGCGTPPVQTGNDQVPDANVEIARAKDGKFETMAWPLVDNLMIDWLPGPSAPGCAVGVAIDDEIVYLHGYGRAVLGNAAEDWSVGTMGSVASVSKTFTALAAMRAVEQGWMDVEEPAGQRLPLSGALAEATLFRLLSHTSGVGGGSREYAYAPNWDGDSAVGDCAGVDTPDPADPSCTETHRHELDPTWLAGEYDEEEADHVAALDGVDVDDDPFIDGWQAVYSNVGYVVAGGMVGAAAQSHGYQGYEDYVWDSVGTWSSNWLTPGQATSLALTHQHRANDIPHRAVGYYDADPDADHEDWQQAELWEAVSDGGRWVGPAGGWALTIGDFTRIVVAFQHDRIVSAPTRSLMEWPVGYFALGPDESNFPPYGLGLFVHADYGTVYNGGDIVAPNTTQSSHGAHWSWWRSALPGGQDVGVTLICNNGKGSAVLYSQAKDIVDALKVDPTSRPFPNVTHATRPSPTVATGTWLLDTTRAYLLAPAGLPMAPSAAGPVILSSDLRQGVVALARAGNRSPLGTLRAELTSGGRLQAGGGALSVPVGPTSVLLRNPTFSLQVSNDGARLYDGLLAGTLDARELVAFPGVPTVEAVCTAVRQAGERCVPCADGVGTCFVAAVGGVSGRRVR